MISTFQANLEEDVNLFFTKFIVRIEMTKIASQISPLLRTVVGKWDRLQTTTVRKTLPQ